MSIWTNILKLIAAEADDRSDVDLYVGTRAADVLDAGNHKSVIIARGGNDILKGGNGNDILIANKGHDVLVGGNGKDYLRGGLGNDAMTGGNGNDVIVASTGFDVVSSGHGNDIVFLTTAQDKWEAKEGNAFFATILDHDLGSDTLIFKGKVADRDLDFTDTKLGIMISQDGNDIALITGVHVDELPELIDDIEFGGPNLGDAAIDLIA